MRGDYDEGRAGDEVGFGTNKTGSAIRAAVRGGRDVRSQFSQCAGQDHVLERRAERARGFKEMNEDPDHPTCSQSWAVSIRWMSACIFSLTCLAF